MDATLSALTDDGRGWIRAQLAAADQFVADYGSPRAGAGLAGLDHAWAAWLDRQNVDPEDPDVIINAVAIAFGQSLVDAVDGLAWVAVTSGEDADLAVSGLPAVDVLIYPADLVAKEYEARAPSFLQRTRDTLIAEINQRRT